MEREIKFKQKQHYGCGVYAVAHAINEESFITEQRLGDSRYGNGIYQLNKWLTEDGYGYEIEPLYVNLLSEQWPLPPKDFGVMPRVDGQYFPFLLEVAPNTSTATRRHLVGCMADQFGNITIMDSMKEEEIVTRWEHLIAGPLYNVVVGVYGFSNSDLSNPGWMMLIHTHPSLIK